MLILLSMFVILYHVQLVLSISWWNTDWEYRKTVTINHNLVAASLNNFPALIDITDADLPSKAQSNGNDIAFTDSSENKLDHEIESYNSGTGHLVAWVRVPSISPTSDTVLYMYYGNAGASSQQNPTGVWDSNFKTVQHFKEVSGTQYDSTSNDHDGTAYNGVVQATPGKIGGADWFDGTDDYVDISGGDIVVGDGHTVSFWEYNMSVVEPTDQFGRIFDDWSGSTGFLWQSPGGVQFQIGNVEDWSNNLYYGHGSLDDNLWRNFAVTFGSGTITLYQDGVQVATRSHNTVISADGANVLLMKSYYGHHISGMLDELEVSNTVRSSAWISTSFNNQKNPSGFCSLGPEESGEAPWITEPAPPNGATGVSVSISSINFTLTDLQSDLMNYTVTTYPDIGSSSGTNVGNTIVSVSVGGLTYLTEYTWHVNVTDGVNWSNETFTFSTSGLSTYDPAEQGWTYYKKILIDHTEVAADLTDFPLLIDVTDFDLAYGARTDGRDILFMNVLGTASNLDYEIEGYDSGSGHLVAWVRVPSLSSTVDTVLYMYYGNPGGVDQQNAAGVWDSNFKTVQHFNVASGTQYDSTTNDHDGTSFNGVIQATAGKIDGANWFDGVDDYMQLSGGDIVVGDGNTLSFWGYNLSAIAPNTFGRIFDDWSGSTGFLLQTYLDSALHGGNVGDWGNAIWYNMYMTDSYWHYFVVTLVGDTLTFYEDGVQLAAQSSSSLVAADGADVTLMTSHEGQYCRGLLDEVEVSNVGRSPAWISTSFNNQRDPSSFYSLGQEELAGAPVISNPSPEDGAAGVPVSLSYLSFSLTDLQGDLMDYTVTTEPSIGSGSGTSVGNGVYSIPVSGLFYFTQYTWHINATDGTHETTVTYTFFSEGKTTFDPSENGWVYRRKITIDHTKVTADLTNFPLLIDTTDANLASHAQTSGGDLLFMDGLGTANKLSHDIEYYDSASGHLTAWVKVPSLSSTSDTTLYMYYGNSMCYDQENTVGTWDSNYMMVQHLSEAAGKHRDSTSHANDGTAYGGVNQGVPGKIDGADSFDGTDDRVNLGSDSSLKLTSMTIELWARPTLAAVGLMVWKGDDTPDNSLANYFIFNQGNGQWCFRVGNGSGGWDNVFNNVAELGSWQYLVATYDGSTMQLWVNGFAQSISISYSPYQSNGPLRFGEDGGGGYRFAGSLDEIRISNAARSASWILTSYNNQLAPSQFYSLSREERAGAPVVSEPSPPDEATGVYISLTQLSFRLTDFEANLINYTVTTSPNVGSGSGVNVGNSVYTVPISGLSTFTTYSWTVYATDGQHWDSVTYSFTTSVLFSFDPADYGWSYRKIITVDHTQVAGTLTNFPMLVDITDAHIAAHAQPDGDDFLFMGGPGVTSKLNHEIESYNSASGHIVAWVNIPSLSSSANTMLFMYYGNPGSTNQQNASGVWDSNFKMVQHFNKASGIQYDSTTNDHDGSCMNGVAQGVAGKIDGADWFDGSDDYVKVSGGDIVVGDGNTVSFWASNLSTISPSTYGRIFDDWFGIAYPGYGFLWQLVGNESFQVGNVVDWDHALSYWTGSLLDDTWHHFEVTLGGGTVTIYKDGQSVATATQNTTVDAEGTDVTLMTSQEGQYCRGFMDELEVSNTMRSAAWISTSYNNQKDPSGFFNVTVGAPAGAPIVSDVSPIDEAVGIPISLGQLSFRLTDYEGNLMNYTVTTSPNVGSGSGVNVGNGIKTVSISGLSISTTYTWYVNVTDGTHANSATFSFTTRPKIYLTNISPPNGGQRGLLNPLLSVDVYNAYNKLMNITFATNATGAWEAIETYTNVGDGSYLALTEGMKERNKMYYWQLNVTDADGTRVEEALSFEIVPYVGPRVSLVARAFCCKFGFIKPSPVQGQFIVTTQQAIHPGPWARYDDVPHFAIYDSNLGWIETYQPIFASGAIYHDSWGYWDSQYHVIDGHTQGRGHFLMIDSPTWEGFQSMDFWDSYYYGPEFGGGNPVNYVFNNSYVWLLTGGMGYYPWSKDSGWGAPRYVGPGGPADLLRLNKTNWLFYAETGAPYNGVLYMETKNAGVTWAGPYYVSNSSVTAEGHGCGRLSFARYGDNIYMFVTDSNYLPVAYHSTDGRNWDSKINVSDIATLCHHGTLLNQGALISTFDDRNQDPAPEYGVITLVPEMLAYPDEPTDLYPVDGARLTPGTTETDLQVVVHGPQTYDVAFYWANGTFINEDKLVQESQTAKVHVTGLSEGSSYSWYAIIRGALRGDWTGGEPLTTSDEVRTATQHFATAPRVYVNPASKTCRQIGETFMVKADVAASFSFTDFEFEYHFNTTLLDYVDVTWNAWGSGTITVDEINGIVTGYTSGSAINEPQTVMTLQFRAAYNHMWKDVPGWTNDLTGTLLFQWANISTPSGPDLSYVKGAGQNDFNVGPDIVYMFSPIRGDTNNDGNVDIIDLRTVAAFYNVREGNPRWAEASAYDLNGDKIIDIFDLVIVSTNYGFKYP